MSIHLDINFSQGTVVELEVLMIWQSSLLDDIDAVGELSICEGAHVEDSVSNILTEYLSQPSKDVLLARLKLVG